MTDPAELNEDEFAAVGRVIVYASALEQMMTAIAVVLRRRSAAEMDPPALRDEMWRSVIGASASTVVTTCRGLSDAVPEDRRTYFDDLLSDVSDLFEARNRVAHGLWDHDERGLLIAWRPLPRRRRRPGEEPIER